MLKPSNEPLINFFGAFCINIVVQVLERIAPMLGPYGPEAFCQESEDSLLVVVVTADVNALFGFKENREKPFAIFVEFVPWHDEHVAIVEVIAAEENVIEGLECFWKNIAHDVVNDAQVGTVVGMFIATSDGCFEVCFRRRDDFIR